MVLQFFEKARPLKSKRPNIFHCFYGHESFPHVHKSSAVISGKQVSLIICTRHVPGSLQWDSLKQQKQEHWRENPLWCQGEPSSSPAAQHREKDFQHHMCRESVWAPAEEGMGFEGCFFTLFHFCSSSFHPYHLPCIRNMTQAKTQDRLLVNMLLHYLAIYKLRSYWKEESKKPTSWMNKQNHHLKA